MLACCISYATSQTVDAHCVFTTVNTRHICTLTGVVLEAGEVLNIITEHAGSFTDDDVVQLNFELSNVSYVPNQVFSQFNRLEELSMNDVGLETINLDSFEGATSLITFSARFNSIRSLNAGVFNGLNQLTVLNLAYNLIDEVSENLFSGLTNLENLHLEGNPLTSADLAGRFSSLLNLQLLELSETRLGNLPANYFNGLTSLTTLHLQRSQISEINVNAFLGLPSLTVLFLYSNSLSNLTGSLFRELSALEILDVSDLGLETLHLTDLDGINNLRELYLEDNRLTGLPLLQRFVS